MAATKRKVKTEDVVVATAVEVVRDEGPIVPPPPKALAAKQNARLLDLESKVLERNLEILDSSARFADFDPDADAPPPGWVEELGLEEAQRRFRVAKCAAMPASAAPIALKMAPAVVTGILKAQAARDNGPKLQLNAQIFQIPMAELPQYERLVLPPKVER